jgi:hypothetical protein
MLKNMQSRRLVCGDNVLVTLSRELTAVDGSGGSGAEIAAFSADTLGSADEVVRVHRDAAPAKKLRTVLAAVIAMR